MKAGLVERPVRATYRITVAGELLLKSGNPLGWEELRSLPDYIQWKNKGGRLDGSSAAIASIEKLEAELTPSESIERSYRQIELELAEELLEQVLSLTPARFERLIVELLLAMGYGDGRAEMGQALGKSGDGGIDGVVNEDKLGLDAVYIQAKRYALDNSVGRPALQAFIGAMTGESASKGVFVTTSSFTREAHDFARRVTQRVVLIDGDRLARLMIDHGVGVRVDKTYVLRSIDANFFDVT
ncbi:restriction system protein [Paracoccus laeviglucosivorans]|uniref:Restriction system protein n=2 Tax=Paracoccus laeviglucosivorans TaxID=1197861 RepID=A0A521AWI9_9RHOB|nr:restriction system protein [Paracoccus laeviglucosivorans]